MKRLGRWTLNALTVLSLVLCLTLTTAVIVQWVRSTHGGELVARNSIRVEPGRTSIINRRAWSTPGTLDLDWNEETEDTSRYTSIGAVPKDVWAHRRYDGDHGHLARAAGDAPDWMIRSGLNWSSGHTPPLNPTQLRQSRFIWVQVRYSFLLGVAIAVNAVPLIALWRTVRRRRRRRSGLCPACSYDLTGNVSGVCPECGIAIAKGNA